MLPLTLTSYKDQSLLILQNLFYIINILYYNNKNFLNFPRTIKNTPLTFLSTILYTVIKVSLS